MKTISANTYRDNRARFPLEELRKYDGQWVAFSNDGKRILASGSNIADLAQKVRAANLELSTVMIEHVEIDSSEIFLGAAELL